MVVDGVVERDVYCSALIDPAARQEGVLGDVVEENALDVAVVDRFAIDVGYGARFEIISVGVLTDETDLDLVSCVVEGMAVGVAF